MNAGDAVVASLVGLFHALMHGESAAVALEAAAAGDSVLRERSVIAPSALREALSALPSGQGFQIGALEMHLCTGLS